MYRTRFALLLLLSLPSILTAECALAAAAPTDEVAAYLRMMWGLLIVLAVILVLYALLRKRFSILNRGGRAIRVVEIQPLMPRKSLCLVEVKGKEYLLGIGSDTITLLAALDASSKTSFQETLENSQPGRKS